MAMRSRKYCVTQGGAILDIIFQLTTFLAHIGVIIWNYMHTDVQQKYFVGVACTLISLELDVLLLVCIAWDADDSLFCWSYACLGCAIVSWSAYMIIAVCMWNIYLGIWAFFYLYIRASLLMIAKAEYLGVFKTSDNNRDVPSPSTIDLGFSSTLSTPMTYRVQTKVREVEDKRTDTLQNSEQNGSTDLNSVPTDPFTLCTFLDPGSNQEPDHYTICNEAIINANEERVVEELNTKL